MDSLTFLWAAFFVLMGFILGCVIGRMIGKTEESHELIRQSHIESERRITQARQDSHSLVTQARIESAAIIRKANSEVEKLVSAKQGEIKRRLASAEDAIRRRVKGERLQGSLFQRLSTMITDHAKGPVGLRLDYIVRCIGLFERVKLRSQETVEIAWSEAEGFTYGTELSNYHNMGNTAGRYADRVTLSFDSDLICLGVVRLTPGRK